ncbi:uncharacterized protein BCR38DRAFT_99249 [Pseudomassariella vexata]|uniref:Uncharacterized protein n=1 Tax=Pseudomassariella vexata TaxID=1141098 RepID=A0A1Y2EET0_9PEZI|nr:uncharacterized protein BCR38DRAFT_99249 [Pseudomassariella vexata]ORY70082.1 hypothetical protein BCR38DRAFT_99249 [Pseudomassariella vexata]
METTFSDTETRFVLGEMIKASSIDVPLLAEFIKMHNVEQNWMYMQLPAGRNMYQCIGAVEKMIPVHIPPLPNPEGLKRKSISDLSDQPIKRQAVVGPIEPAIPPRIIQPRPPPPNGYLATAPASSPSVTSTGKKRGRPSKADKEAQARACYSRSIEYPPITPAPQATSMALAPQRDYASSPGYEIASNPLEQNSKKRARPSASDYSPAAAYPLASPASTTETPRALPEPIELVEQATRSPRDHPQDLRSPRQPQLQQPPQAPSMQAPRHPQAYEQYRGPDPIFPDRDRSRSASDHIPREAPAAPPMTNRS